MCAQCSSIGPKCGTSTGLRGSAALGSWHGANGRVRASDGVRGMTGLGWTRSGVWDDERLDEG
jgi:hypothetical protein